MPGETFVEFNPLVAEAIRMLSFQQVSHEALMGTNGPISRWLIKRLHLQIVATDKPLRVMTPSEIRRDSGMPEWKHTRNLLRRVTQAVDLLRQRGILSKVETTERKSRQRKEDFEYVMTASEWFAAQARRSKQQMQENLEDFARVANGRTPSEGFLPLPAAEIYSLRDRR